MSSPSQKHGSCGHIMASFDSHNFWARCREKGVTVTGKRGSNYRLSLSCNRKSKKLNLTNLFNSQQ